MAVRGPCVAASEPKNGDSALPAFNERLGLLYIFPSLANRQGWFELPRMREENLGCVVQLMRVTVLKQPFCSAGIHFFG